MKNSLSKQYVSVALSLSSTPPNYNNIKNYLFRILYYTLIKFYFYVGIVENKKYSCYLKKIYIKMTLEVRIFLNGMSLY